MWSIFFLRIVLNQDSLLLIMCIPIIRIIWPTMTAGRMKSRSLKNIVWKMVIITPMAFIWNYSAGIIKCRWLYRNSASLPPEEGHSLTYLQLDPRAICRNRNKGRLLWKAIKTSAGPDVPAVLFFPGRMNGLKGPGIPWLMLIYPKRHIGVISRQMNSSSDLWLLIRARRQAYVIRMGMWMNGARRI